MKILIIGALRFSNYGDILFAKLFYNEILKKEKKENIYLYESFCNPVSDFCKKELGYTNKFNRKDFKKIECFVYISGGYFSNNFNNFSGRILWKFRYGAPGLYAAKHKKKLIISGIGGGDFVDKKTLNYTRKIFNAAEFLTIRNKGSYEKFCHIGIKNNNMICTEDTALLIPKSTLQKEKKDIIFLHIIPINTYFEKMIKTVFPAVLKFVRNNPQFTLIYGFDGLPGKREDKFVNQAKNYFRDIKNEYHKYISIDEFTSFLSSCKVVITSKLHVGIVSSLFESSVFSCPINYTKASRFYEEINQKERCINLETADPNILYELLSKYYMKTIDISENLIEKAKANLDFLKKM